MILLIACGNRLRQDDAAGLVLAERLAAAWRAQRIPVRHRPVHQLLPEIAPEIAAADVTRVVFIDCRPAESGQDTAVRVARLGQQESSPVLGHHITPELLLLYAGELFDPRPPAERPPAWQVTVPGYDFGHADRLSAACQAVVEAAPAALTPLLGEIVNA